MNTAPNDTRDSPDADLPVSYHDVVAAARRLAGKAHVTTVMRSRSFDRRVDAEVHFKCENLQRIGAFKFRGAYNALACLRERGGAGALAYSSGNHAQAMALAGSILEIPVTVVMPEDAPAVKLQATRGYGAEVVTYDAAAESREVIGRRLAAERGLELIPPFDHPDVVAGQGTAAKELLQETGPLDLLVVPCGGGGLLSGCALAARALAPGCRVVGVEPELGDDATRSFHSGTLQTVHNPPTIADGARTPSLGEITFPLVTRCVDDMVTVSDEALIRTLLFLLQRTKLLVEPTGALAAAAVLEGVVEAPRARIGVVISGGNVDPRALAGWLAT